MAEQRELLINSISEANALLSPSANATPEQMYDAIVYLLAQAQFGRVAHGLFQKVYAAESFQRDDDGLFIHDSVIPLTSNEIAYMQGIEDKANK